MPFQLLLGALACNVIWSLNPVMGKIILRDFSAIHFGILRHGSALVGYVLLVIGYWGFRAGRARDFFALPASSADWRTFAYLGLFTFCSTPLLAAIGLNASQASDNALIIAMEPLITVFIAWVILGERVAPRAKVGFFLAFVGFLLLSRMSFSSGMHQNWHFLGNLLILLSLCGEGAYSSFIRLLLPRYSPTQIFGTGLLLGVFILFIISLIWAGPVPLSQVNFKNFLAILWIGPIGTTLTYHYWSVALGKGITIAALALTLFLQPVLGAIWGILFLNESLSVLQSIGAMLILLALALQTLKK